MNDPDGGRVNVSPGGGAKGMGGGDVNVPVDGGVNEPGDGWKVVPLDGGGKVVPDGWVFSGLKIPVVPGRGLNPSNEG